LRIFKKTKYNCSLTTKLGQKEATVFLISQANRHQRQY